MLLFKNEYTIAPTTDGRFDAYLSNTMKCYASGKKLSETLENSSNYYEEMMNEMYMVEDLI